MDIAPISRKNVSEQVAESIRDTILAGSLSAGDRLPSERELAERFEVNRSSIREALGRLQALGMVETRQGGGIIVRDFLADGGLAILPYLLSPNGATDPRMFTDVLEVRAAFCSFLAEQAAKRASASDLASLRQILLGLEAAETPFERQRQDFEFFRTLADATGNRVLILVLNAIRRVYLENAILFEALYSNEQFSSDPHQRVVAAVAAGDGATAAREVRAWMDLDRQLIEPLASGPGPLDLAE